MAYAETCLLLKLASPIGKDFGLSGCTASPKYKRNERGEQTYVGISCLPHDIFSALHAYV
jgi:hypothetical protein